MSIGRILSSDQTQPFFTDTHSESNLESKIDGIVSQSLASISENSLAISLSNSITNLRFSTSESISEGGSSNSKNDLSDASISEEGYQGVSGEGELDERRSDISGEGDHLEEQTRRVSNEFKSLFFRKPEDDSTYESTSEYSSSESRSRSSSHSSTNSKSVSTSVGSKESSSKSTSASFKKSESGEFSLSSSLEELEFSEGALPKTEKFQELGSGSFKKVYLAEAYLKPKGENDNPLPGSKYQKQKGTPKSFVYQLPKDSVQALKVEAEMLLKLRQLLNDNKDLEGKDQLFIKNYVVKDDMIISKLANFGEATDVIKHLSVDEKAYLLLNAIKGVMFLNSNGIAHNDIMVRNILVHAKQEWASPDSNAIGRIIGKDVVINGKRIVKKGTCLEQRHIDRLQKRNAGQIKVYSRDFNFRGMLADFGCAQVISEKKRTHHPQDTSAPEILARKSRGNEKTDAFSVGQTIVEVFLYKGRDTDFSKNLSYTTEIIERAKKRVEKYNSLSQSNFANGSVSAISRKEYKELTKIDPNLAKVVRKLMSYNPAERPDLGEVLIVLQNLAK